MATLTPTQNPADVGNQTTGNTGGDKPKTNKIIIGKPFEAGGRTDNVIKFIQVDGGPRLISGWKIHDGSRVEVFGRGLERYDQIALWMGGGRKLIAGGDVRKKLGGEGLDFTAKFSTDLYANGLPIEVEFLQSNRPDNDRTLVKRFFYKAETEEEKKKREAMEAEKAREKAVGGGQGPGAVSEFLNAGLSPLGDMAGVLKSTTDVSSVGAKTIGQSGTAAAAAAGKSISDETSGGGDEQAELYEEETVSQPIISTSEISTGGQTFGESGTASMGGQTTSESGTVSAGGQTIRQGSADVARTIFSGGTVEAAGSAGVRTEVASTVQGVATEGGSSGATVIQKTNVSGGASGTAGMGGSIVSEGQTNVSAALSGQSASTQEAGAGAETKGTESVKESVNLTDKTEVKTQSQTGRAAASGGTATGGGTLKSSVTQKVSAGGESSETDEVSNRTVSGAQSNLGTKISAQFTGEQGVSVKEKETVKSEGPVTENLESKAEIKTNVKDSQAPGSGGATQGLAGALRPPQPLSGQGITKASEGTAGMASVLPTFGGGTRPSAPAGLGSMLKNAATLNLNISTGSSAVSSAVNKSPQGGASAGGALGGKTETDNEGAAKSPKKSGQTKPEEPPTSLDQKEGGGLPAPQPVAGEKPADEAKPPSEAAPEPAGEEERPKNDTEVPPPLGQTGGLHGQKPEEPEGQQAQQPESRPIDSANGPSRPGEKNDLEHGDSQMGEPLQMPQVPETGGEIPDGPLSAGNKGTGGFPHPESEPGMPAKGATEAAGALPEVGVPAAAEGAGAKALAGETAAGAAAAVPVVAAALLAESLLTPKTKWWVAFGSSFLAILTFFGFFIAWSQMVVAWVEGNKAGPNKSLGQGQKIVTIFHFFTPFLVWGIFIFIIIAAGCNWPGPIRTSVGNNYSFTVVGAFIGDDCKYFDVSNTAGSGTNSSSNTPFGGGSAGGAGASSNWNASPTAAGPITPLGPSPSTGATSPPH